MDEEELIYVEMEGFSDAMSYDPIMFDVDNSLLGTWDRMHLVPRLLPKVQDEAPRFARPQI